MIDGNIVQVKDDKGSEGGEPFKLILGKMRRANLIEHIKKKEFDNDLLVPYMKLIEQTAPDVMKNDKDFNFKEFDY